MLAIAALHYLTLMALPLTLIWLGSRFVVVPIVTGFVLEALRSQVRHGLKREVRSSMLRDAALQALDKRTLVPEAEVDTAFWAAQLIEYAVTVDVPAVMAAGIAGASVLGLAFRAAGATAIAGLLALLLAMLVLGAWSNRRRAAGLDAVIEHRHRSASWVAAAERDGGEIYGERARGPFLAQLTGSVRAWSKSEGEIERKRLQHRLLLGLVFCLGVLAFLRSEQLDPFQLDLARSASALNLSGLLLLGTGVPIAYVFWTHADSLLTARAALKQLRPSVISASLSVQPLVARPSRLTACALSFAYPSSPRPALAGLELDLDLSRITLIVAPNGAGKTTLARLICGVLTPDSGSIQLDGVACSAISRDDFGFVPQNPLVVESLTIEANVHLVAPDVATDAIERVLSELGLLRPTGELAGQLSRGEQRRIAIARAILKQPRLLLLDEPDVWLDEDGRVRLAAILARELSQRAVIVVSHRTEWLLKDANVIDLSSLELLGASAPATPSAEAKRAGSPNR